ncbi:MAG: serine/threonine protein kinase, partial [Moorea sp. SIO2B7]|nr:serine/threonine protein kinase [Moorena sp. SIO2B7]
SPSLIDNQESESSSTFSEEEWQRKNALRRRRLDLGLNYNFYLDLINNEFWKQHPSEKGRTLTNKPEDKELRESWNTIATEMLEKLSFLSPEAIERMGSYNRDQRKSWKGEVNRLRLSSRALYDLADAEFFHRFPEQENQKFIDQPIGQVWNAIIFDKIKALQSGEAYERLIFTSDAIELKVNGTLKPGEGKAYVAQLNSDQLMDVKLKTDQKTFLSIYSPTGRVTILEDSQIRKWSGTLPEKGYYEFTIVSKAKKSLNYQLDLTVQETETPPETI